MSPDFSARVFLICSRFSSQYVGLTAQAELFTCLTTKLDQSDPNLQSQVLSTSLVLNKIHISISRCFLFKWAVQVTLLHLLLDNSESAAKWTFTTKLSNKFLAN